MKGVTLAWLVFVTVQTVQYERAHPATLPPPRTYAASAVVFSVLGLVATTAPQPAALMGWALVIAGVVTNDFGQLAPASSAPKKAPTKKGK